MIRASLAAVATAVALAAPSSLAAEPEDCRFSWSGFVGTIGGGVDPERFDPLKDGAVRMPGPWKCRTRKLLTRDYRQVTLDCELGEATASTEASCIRGGSGTASLTRLAAAIGNRST
jgi:hypothetical protein